VHPAQFDDTLFDIPKRGQEPKDVLEASKTLLQLKKDFNFKKIIQDLEELVLADSGKDEFNEIFKLIFAKIWDEKEAQENRRNKVVEFRKALDPEIVRRQSFWDRRWLKIRESLAPLVCNVMRLADGAASGGWRWSFV
jgi:hypothetical protein